ncbi:hypothetical protein O0L34_g6769 [Tuta absoluta]|nr:hypothetical protein O0L34_g6769 [Tuta absoluta]
MEGLNPGDLDLYRISLSQLTVKAHHQLSCLLNTKKILFSDGPDRLPRDWRGIASLINISAEIANSYETDKIDNVIKYWIAKRDGTATVGKLLEYVQKLDRYDIFDDLMELEKEGYLLVNQPERGPPCNIVAMPTGQEIQLWNYEEDNPEENIITFDDKIHGRPQFYHAYVMYAIEDKEFVDEMLDKMRERGFKLCTEEDVLPDHATPYAPVSRLISSDRCHRIILVYSPDFLTSAANNFYMDYAQAVDISKMKKPKIIPCMYRSCQLPPQMTFYHKLYYTSPGAKSSYNFWDRLAMALDIRVIHNNGRLGITYNTDSMSHSALNITEVTTTGNLSLLPPGNLLALPAPASKSSIDINFDSQDSLSSNMSGIGRKKQKKNALKKLFNSVKFGKKKDKELYKTVVS